MRKSRVYDGVIYEDPRDELKARAAKVDPDPYVAIPVELIMESVSLRECSETTVVNGDRTKGVLIEIKCRRATHTEGLHANGRIHWGRGTKPALKNDSRDFVTSVADYLMTHESYDAMDKRAAIMETVRVMTGDIGLAQDFLNAIGVEVDLYESR